MLREKEYFHNFGGDIIIYNSKPAAISINYDQYSFFGCAHPTAGIINYFDNQAHISARIHYNFKLFMRITNENHITRSYISLFLFFCRKIKFSGKGYKLKKTKKKQFKFYFGYSHKIYILTQTITYLKVKKYKSAVISTNYFKLVLMLNILRKIRHINKFTKRGIRFSREIILKRPGKQNNF